MAAETTPVESFGEYPSKIDDLLAYPGARPAGSFITDDVEVLVAPDNYQEFQQVANDHLASRGQMTLEGRIPVLGYGANANPARLRDKLAKYGLAGADSIVPFVQATVEDAAAVWHGRPGQSGSIFAELYRGPETAGQLLTTHLSFLSPVQAAVIHASEGATYSPVELRVYVGSEGIGRRVLAYAGLDASILLRDGQPIAVAGLANTAPLQQYSAEEAVDYILGQDGVAKIAGARTAREYVAHGLDMKLAAKKARQAAVHQRLAELGDSRNYTYPAESHEFIGRLAFGAQVNLDAIHPTGVQDVVIAESVLDSIRPERPEDRGGKADIMSVLRTRVMGARRESGLQPGELALQMQYRANSSTTTESDV